MANKVWSAGQVAGMITSCPSVEEIFQEILEGYRAAFRRLPL
jgi:NAD(P)H-dependent flavin oxidoreductase YrpB (nitropropane dioxygenase family)